MADLKSNWVTDESFAAEDQNLVALGIHGLNQSGAFASLPAAGFTGRLYHCTDTDAVYQDNGTTWERVRFGHGGTTQPEPPSASWSNVNIGSASFAASLDGRLFTAPSNGGSNSVRMEVRTLTPSSNYTATAYIQVSGPTANSWGPVGLVLKNSGGNPVIVFGVEYGSNLARVRVTKFNSPTSFSADYNVTNQSQFFGPVNWLRIRDSGTTRFFEYSYDGVEWPTALISHSRTDFLTADQIGWGGDPHSQAVTARLRSFSVV